MFRAFSPRIRGDWIICDGEARLDFGAIAYTLADLLVLLERCMGLAAMSAVDQPLYELVCGPAPVTIAEVVARMQAMDAVLAVNDGIKWFNRLYLMVTEQVDLDPPGHVHRDCHGQDQYDRSQQPRAATTELNEAADERNHDCLIN